MPASVQAGFQGTAASFRDSLSNEGLLILAALVTQCTSYSASSTRALSIPSRFSPRCRQPAWARCSR
jgi:hypothetical protein